LQIILNLLWFRWLDKIFTLSLLPIGFYYLTNYHISHSLCLSSCCTCANANCYQFRRYSARILLVSSVISLIFHDGSWFLKCKVHYFCILFWGSPCFMWDWFMFLLCLSSSSLECWLSQQLSHSSLFLALMMGFALVLIYFWMFCSTGRTASMHSLSVRKPKRDYHIFWFIGQGPAGHCCRWNSTNSCHWKCKRSSDLHMLHLNEPEQQIAHTCY
jgi:hypothetical protein